MKGKINKTISRRRFTLLAEAEMEERAIKITLIPNASEAFVLLNNGNIINTKD